MATSSDYEYITKGLEVKVNAKLWYSALVVLTAISALLFTFDMFSLLDVKSGLAESSGDLITKYLLIVVAVERAAAVYVGMSRNETRADWTARLIRVNAVLEDDTPHLYVVKQIYSRERNIIDQLERKGLIKRNLEDIDEDDILNKAQSASQQNAQASGVPQSTPVDRDKILTESYIGYLTVVKHIYDFHRNRYNAVTNRYVSWIVFMVGVFLAFLGLSLFQDVFETIKVGNDAQTFILRFSDTVITGGLLGGGSAGLNVLMTKMSDYTNKK